MSSEDPNPCPVLEISLCCEHKKCRLMRVCIHNPEMEEGREDDEGRLVPVAYFPLDHAQELIDMVTAFARSKGLLKAPAGADANKKEIT